MIILQKLIAGNETLSLTLPFILIVIVFGVIYAFLNSSAFLGFPFIPSIFDNINSLIFFALEVIPNRFLRLVRLIPIYGWNISSTLFSNVLVRSSSGFFIIFSPGVQLKARCRSICVIYPVFKEYALLLAGLLLYGCVVMSRAFRPFVHADKYIVSRSLIRCA